MSNRFHDYVSLLVDAIDKGYNHEPPSLMAIREALDDADQIIASKLAEMAFDDAMDAIRYRYIEKHLAQMTSPKMNGEHHWNVRPLYTTGITFGTALDKARWLNRPADDQTV